MKKIYYIGYYTDPEREKKRSAAPAADTKITYVVSTLKKLGYDVEILSWCSANERTGLWKKHAGYIKDINGVNVRFFDSYSSKSCFFRAIGRKIQWYKRISFISNNCLGKNDTIIIYHSLSFIPLMKYLVKKKKDFILEMEEIYADVIGSKRIKKCEVNTAELATGYIFPTSLLNEVINKDKKPAIIVHGTYNVEIDRKVRVFDLNHVHCVYAGTFDPRKGGCDAAISAAEFLPSNYHLHIIGFGTDQEIKTINEKIKAISTKSKAIVTYDGLMVGDDYIQFLQSCDIGLSTQNPEAAFNSTSFPSKILSYLSNGLRVVSVRIPAIEKSEVGDMLYYYDHQTAEEIANAIQSVNLSNRYDSRDKIMELHNHFSFELKSIIK